MQLNWLATIKPLMRHYGIRNRKWVSPLPPVPQLEALAQR